MGTFEFDSGGVGGGGVGGGGGGNPMLQANHKES